MGVATPSLGTRCEEHLSLRRPVLKSSHEQPLRHWELDDTGQPTQPKMEYRRSAQFITPIPGPSVFVNRKGDHPLRRRSLAVSLRAAVVAGSDRVGPRELQDVRVVRQSIQQGSIARPRELCPTDSG